MTALFNRLLNSLYSFLPWNQNPHKRLRDDSSDENEENFNIGVSSAKKQKLQRVPFGQKVLKVMNPPTVTTVKTSFKGPSPARLQITEDFYQPRRKLASKSSLPHKWGVVCLNDDGKPPKHVSSPVKSRRRLMSSTPIASIDLTKNDNNSFEEYQTTSSSFVDIDLTKLDTSDEQGKPQSPIKKYPSVVDLTGPDSDNMSLIRKTLSMDKSGGAGLLKKKSCDQLSKKSNQSVFSIDLTSENADKLPGRKKQVNEESTNPAPIAVIDLEERNSYGRVLGSMLEGKLPVNSQLRPTNLNPETLVDLTSEDDEVREVNNRASATISDSDSSVKYVAASPVTEIKDDTYRGSSSLLKNGTKYGIVQVNSFESKLKDVPCTHQDWVMNLMKEYQETQRSFIEARDRFYREATAWSDENRKAVEELLEKKLERHLKITEALINEVPVEKYASIILPTPQLSKAAEAKIKAALVRSPESEVLIDKFSLPITRRDIQTLNGLNWLNDEVINFYMQLLEDRTKNKENFPSLHTFNTFFYAGLQSRGHSGMKRWTKKVNIFEKELVIIPIHLHMHWCLVVIDLVKKELNYYDSMGHDNNECLKHMSNYLRAEHEVKQGSPLDTTDWKIQNIKNIPQQMNGSDCGIFACTYAEYSSRRAPFDFDQSKMQYFRRKMVYEIITGQLL